MYTKFSCPYCQSVFSNEFIAIAHHSGKCPYCKELIRVDGTDALPRTFDTQIGNFVVLAIYAVVVWSIIRATGFEIPLFISKSKILAYFLLALISLPGIALIHWYEAYEQRKLLKKTLEQVNDGDI